MFHITGRACCTCHQISDNLFSWRGSKEKRHLLVASGVVRASNLDTPAKEALWDEAKNQNKGV